jgi:hypothetical protein
MSLVLVPGETCVFVARQSHANLLGGCVGAGVGALVATDLEFAEALHPAHFEYFVFQGLSSGWDRFWFERCAVEAVGWAARRARLGQRVAFADSSGGRAGAALLAAVFLVVHRGCAAGQALDALRAAGVPCTDAPAAFTPWLHEIGACSLLPGEGFETPAEATARAARMRWARTAMPAIARDGPLERAAAAARAAGAQRKIISCS